MVTAAAAVGAGTSNSFQDILSPRRRSHDFRWASRPFNPSPCFFRGSRRPLEPKELIEAVLNSQRVKEVTGKDRDLERKAQEILTEMSHDYKLYSIRWFAYVLSKLAKSHFTSINVDTSKIDRIRDMMSRYPVIVLPTHRSYLDFLLTSYVFFAFDLPLPVIAAGMDFMGMLGVAELLRKSGAFFIRRRFGNDKLYWALISEYVQALVLKGAHPLEIFLEGTRSRSGKSLPPKVGLLTQIAELVKSRAIPDVVILPVSISYDRTLEETLYARELLGQPKPKESTGGLIQALKWLSSQSYGGMHVKFGDFLSIREALGEPVISPCYQDTKAFQIAVENLALSTLLQHQRDLRTITPLFSGTALVLLSVLSKGEKVIGFPSLVTLLTQMTRFGVNFALPLPGDRLEWNLRHVLDAHQALCLCPKDEQHMLYIISGQDEAVDGVRLQHYANQALPFLLPFSLVTVLFKSRDLQQPDWASLSLSEIKEDYVLLRQLLYNDFLYQPGTEEEELETAVSQLNTFLAKIQGLDHSNSDQRKVEETKEFLDLLRTGVEPYLLSYWGVGTTLIEVMSKKNGRSHPQEPIEVKALAKMAQGYLRQLLGSHFPFHWGCLSLDTLSNAGMGLVRLGVADKVKMGNNGAYGIVTSRAENLIELISKIERNLPISNPELDCSQLIKLKAKL